jgi:hypothetical protein
VKRLIAVFALLVAASAHAQNELALDVTSDRATAQTGERFAATITIRNVSTVDVTEIRLQFGFLRGTLIFDLTAPAGWNCSEPPTDRVVCTEGTLAAGAEAMIRATLLTPNHLDDTRANATISWRAPGRPVASRAAVLPLTVTASSRRADVGADFRSSSVREGETVDVTFDVRNHGPDAVERVWVWLYSMSASTFRGVSGNGWTCEPRICTRASLAPGETAPLTVRVEAPREPTQITAGGFIAPENTLETQFGNNYPSHSLFVANAERYEKLLLPLTPGLSRGANGSLWDTRVTMLIASDTPIQLFPTPCIIGICPPPNPPLRTPFLPESHRLIDSESSDPRGWFFYTGRGDASKLRVNIRTHDLSRALLTWGTEIPVVRESDVTTDRVVLLDVLHASDFRHTLRVYDFDGIDGAQVRINVHAMFRAEPLATFTRTLVARGLRATFALLPQQPAYVAFDSRELPPIDPIQQIWYSIEPLTPGLRLWAYVTVTHNVTQHVTTISPQ